MLDKLWQDLRLGARMLLRRPSFSLFTILTLAAGLGVNIAIFSVLNAVMLAPLPYPSPQRLALMWSSYKGSGSARVPAAGPELAELRLRARSFEQIAGIWAISATVTGAGEPEQLRAGLVTVNFFSTLGVQPALGRNFLPEEEQANTRRVVILSDAVWRRKYGADPGLIGKPIYLSGAPITVIGVLPRDFRPLFPTDSSVPDDLQIWLPMGDPARMPRGQEFIRMIGRLRPGVTIEQARAEVDAVAARLRSEFPEYQTEDFLFQTGLLHPELVKSVRPALLAVFGAVVLVVLMACANVGSLLLTRTTERARELNIRRALGAPQGRLISQVLCETLVLALSGGFIAVLLAGICIRLLPLLRPGMLPHTHPIALNWTVLLFAAALSLATGIALGLLPTLVLPRTHLNLALQEGGRTSSASARRYYDIIIAAEVTFGLVLLVGAVLMFRTFSRLIQVQPGFNPSHVLTFQISLPGQRYRTHEQRVNFMNDLRRNLSSLAEVRGAGAISHIPFGTTPPNWYDYFWPENAPADQQGKWMADLRSTTPGFLQTIGATLVAGRDINDADDAQHPRVIVVDETVAREAFPGRDPLGQKLRVGAISPTTGFGADVATIVGVVRHVRNQDLTREVRGQIYEPFAQSPRFPMTFAVRTAADPDSLLAAVRAQVTGMDKDLPIANPRTMDSYLDDARSQSRFTLLLAAILGSLALALACVGIYGVTALAVARRAREIGIRLALGARPGSVVSLMLRQGMTPVLLGVIVGVLGAAWLTPLLASLLFGVRPLDPGSFTVAAACLLAVGGFACYASARRAVDVDPVLALRSE
ncbi:MAG TPA: ABC transporter permease [Terriglobales bacterium]|nr:ABC transporter permease [Terriglobales bacterium]